jgi:membrane protein implicated in regulation of membrane protease activity
MRKALFLNTQKQLHAGEIVSGAGFLLYIALSALKIPEAALAAELAVFSVFSVWTLVSMIVYPRSRKKKEVSYNLLWGQGALTILLVACEVLTVRGLLSR